MNNVLVIGAGSVGSRHIQSLLCVPKKDINIYVIEPSKKSILSLSDLFQGKKELLSRVNFTTWSEVPKEIFMAIIATDSRPRLSIIKALFENKIFVKFLIFEKVLFNKIKNFKLATKFLHPKTTSFVNCPLRVNPFFKKMDKKGEPHDLTVFGSNWKMASNAIHFLDLWCYINQSFDFKLTNFGLEKKLHKSKRAFYKEFFGFLTFENNLGAKLNLNCFKSDILSYSYQIDTGECIYKFEPMQGYSVMKIKDKSRTKLLSYNEELQSDLTQMYFKSLLTTGRVNLTELNESSKIHLVYLDSLLSNWSSITKHSPNEIPIT